MSVKNIYFDEAGFTGYNMLDKNQPIFAIASSDINPELAEKILKESFPNYKGAEFKFSNIWHSRNASGLITFASKLREFHEELFVWAIDKKYAVLLKIVDYLIEPHVTDAGYDFYADGFCWKYTNYIYFSLQNFSSESIFAELIDVYQKFSRYPSEETLNALTSQLSQMAFKAEKYSKLFLEQMALGATLFRQYHELEDFKKTNDLQLTAMLALVGHWRKKTSDDFSIIYDGTANFSRRYEQWSSITDSNVASFAHTLGDNSELQFPLRVLHTIAENSEDNYSIQLCDILAGLTARLFDDEVQGADRELLNKAVEAGLSNLSCDYIHPTTVFPDFPPKKLDGPDALDRFALNISRGHKK